MSTRPSSTATQFTANVAELRERVGAARRAGLSIGLVPTMGALHEGHLSLLDASRRECGFSVVTIFVNPAQFGPSEDFSRYPRTLELDQEMLSARGSDLIFAPTTDAMYAADHATYVDVAGPALPLEGEFRPGHFRGVATIVLKLFNLVQPDRAYFGQKDYQQTIVVRRMVDDLDLPIQIEICPTVREPDGLALSSRNIYLTSDERQRALSISQSLQAAKDLAEQGTTNVAEIVDRMEAMLRAANLKIDYVAIADRETLAPIAELVGPAVALIAARVGATRLIDNQLIGT